MMFKIVGFFYVTFNVLSDLGIFERITILLECFIFKHFKNRMIPI